MSSIKNSVANSSFLCVRSFSPLLKRFKDHYKWKEIVIYFTLLACKYKIISCGIWYQLLSCIIYFRKEEKDRASLLVSAIKNYVDQVNSGNAWKLPDVTWRVRRKTVQMEISDYLFCINNCYILTFLVSIVICILFYFYYFFTNKTFCFCK